MFVIRFVDSALEDLEFLRKLEQRHVVSMVELHLSSEPLTPTRNRKSMRPNSLADWELRLGSFRVFYEVDLHDKIVWVKAVGQKEHNRLWIRGKEVKL